MTIEEVKTEYFRIEKLLRKEALTGDEYNANCQQGYSVFQIKKKMGMSWNEMKKTIGAKNASYSNKKGGAKKSKKILCNRDGSMISSLKCVPGCNNACLDCSNKQTGNIQAGGDTLTHEEHKEQTLAGTYRSSGVIAVEEGHSEI